MPPERPVVSFSQLRMTRRALLNFSAGLVMVWVLPAAEAQGQLVRAVRLEAENDSFNFWLPVSERSDYEYTHGARITLTTNSAWGWGERFAPGMSVCALDAPATERCLVTVWELGHQIFTPRINSRHAIEGQRPYAGWLYGAISAVSQRKIDRHAVRLEVGTTGPPSLAGALQTAVHRIGGFWMPLGWSNQLAFEPGLLLRYDYDRVLAAPELGGVRVAEVTTRTGLSAGNVITGANGDITVRLGFNVPGVWNAAEEKRIGLYLLAGVRADAYLRNLFLDGNTFHESARVDKLPFVGRNHVGLGFRVKELELMLNIVSRGREYRTEESGHRFTSFGLGYRH